MDADRPGAEGWVPKTRRVERLREAVQGCRGCELWRHATQVVFGDGPTGVAMMLVGEQPGDREDLAGEPFVGPAGRILDRALNEAGIERARVYVTNAVKHFRFEERGKRRLHRRPEVGHIEACRPWLAAEFSAVSPRVVVCLGATAGRAVLGRPVKIAAERGAVISLGEASAFGGAAVVVTVHPSSILRLRGTPEREAAIGDLVADLQVALAAT
jgi:uracil-DNA glycosylase family protein